MKLSKYLAKSGSDVLCVIDRTVPAELAETFEEHRCFDKAFDSQISCFKSPRLDLPVIYAPVAELTDYTDVRCYQKAAAQSLERAIKVSRRQCLAQSALVADHDYLDLQAGFKAPLLVVPQSKRFSQTELCTVLGALEELYVVRI